MIPSSRDAVLARIRSALGATPRTDAARAELESRMASPPRWTRLAVEDDIVARFIAKARANLSEVQPIASLQELGSAVEATLAERGETRDISIAPTLRDVSWPANWMINFGKGRVSEKVSITDALAGVAETGSLIFASATDRPTSLNFLPELHIAVLRNADIVANFEDAWPRLRALGIWPRTVNIISAASRTADVAQIIVRPAHGPKLLHIMLLESG